MHILLPSGVLQLQSKPQAMTETIARISQAPGACSFVIIITFVTASHQPAAVLAQHTTEKSQPRALQAAGKHPTYSLLPKGVRAQNQADERIALLVDTPAAAARVVSQASCLHCS